LNPFELYRKVWIRWFARKRTSRNMQASGKQSVAQIREIVLSGTLRQLETLRAQVSPEVAAMNQYPRLDPARPGFCVSSKKLKIGSVKELKQSLASGEIAGKLGSRIDAHVRQA